MELLKDYDCTIEYHLGKENVVADALSQKTIECFTEIICYEIENLVALRTMNVSVNVRENHLLATLQIKSSLVDQIRSAQMKDSYLKKMKAKVEAGVNTQFTIREDGLLVIGNHMCVSDMGN